MRCAAAQHPPILRTLDIFGNDAPPGFMRDHLLPAVRVNTGLRALQVYSVVPFNPYSDDRAAALEAERIVAAR